MGMKGDIAAEMGSCRVPYPQLISPTFWILRVETHITMIHCRWGVLPRALVFVAELICSNTKYHTHLVLCYYGIIIFGPIKYRDP